MTRRRISQAKSIESIPKINTDILRLDMGAGRLVADWADSIFDPAIYGDTRIQCARQHIEQARAIEGRYAQWQHDDADGTEPGRAFVDYGLIRKAKAPRVDTEARIHGAFWIIGLLHDTYHCRKYAIISNIADTDWPGPLMRWQAHAAVKAMASGCYDSLVRWFTTEEAVDAVMIVAGALGLTVAAQDIARPVRRATVNGHTSPPRWTKPMTRQARALAVLVYLKRDPDIDNAELARQMKVNVRTVERWRNDPVIREAWYSSSRAVPRPRAAADARKGALDAVDRD